MAMQEYDFNIKYCKTSDNKMTITLSRYPPVQQETYTSDKNEIQILAVKYALPNELKSLLKNINCEQQWDDKIKKLLMNLKLKKIPNFKFLTMFYTHS